MASTSQNADHIAGRKVEPEETIAMHLGSPLDRITAVLSDDDENSDALAALVAAAVTLLCAGVTDQQSRHPPG